MKPMHTVEAALFSAGRPLGVDEMAESTDLTKAQVEKALKELVAAYKDRDTALEVGRAGGKWGMQVRAQVSSQAAKFAQMEIPAKTLKTLALIAYHQPVKQSELTDMIGSRVYDHVPELLERGLIRTRAHGQTKIITTTAAFPEYFGLDAQTPEEIRLTMAKLVGIDPAKEKPKGLEGFAAALPSVPDEAAAPAVEAAPEQSPPTRS